MDQILISIVFLIVITTMLSAVVLPIIALVISIRSKKKLTEQISWLAAGQSPPVPGALQPSELSGEASLVIAIQQLRNRVETLEAAMAAHSISMAAPHTERARSGTERTAEPAATEPLSQVEPPQEALLAGERQSPVVPEFRPAGSVASRPPALSSMRPRNSEQIESIIGRRAVGWAAVCLILFAAAFFLKYAFDNRWIGELGRVAVGVAAGVSMTVFGFKYHRRGWRVWH